MLLQAPRILLSLKEPAPPHSRPAGAGSHLLGSTELASACQIQLLLWLPRQRTAWCWQGGSSALLRRAKCPLPPRQSRHPRRHLSKNLFLLGFSSVLQAALRWMAALSPVTHQTPSTQTPLGTLHLGSLHSWRQGCHFQARPSQAALFSFPGLGARRGISRGQSKGLDPSPWLSCGG